MNLPYDFPNVRDRLTTQAIDKEVILSVLTGIDADFVGIVFSYYRE